MSDADANRTEENRATTGAAFEAWSERRSAITDVFAPELVWRVEGTFVAAKQYESKQQFVDEVLAPFGARFAASADPFRPIAVRAIYADGDTVIVLWDGRGTANDGEPYENSYAWVLKMKDGLVVEGTAFFDSITFDDLWTRVRPEQ